MLPLHKRTHSAYTEGCPACKWLTLNISADVLESRGKPIRAIEARERRWHRDMGAYRRLRREDIQPPQIDGSADVEARAQTRDQIETGLLNVKPRAFDAFHNEFGFRATEPAP